MKAMILQTGELIEVIFSHKSKLSNDLFYQDIATGNLYPCNELRFTDVSDHLPIDWKQQKFELMKVAMQGMLANSRYLETAYNKAENEKVEVEFIIAFNAARYADAIIAKLKEE